MTCGLCRCSNISGLLDTHELGSSLKQDKLVLHLSCREFFLSFVLHNLRFVFYKKRYISKLISTFDWFLYNLSWSIRVYIAKCLIISVRRFYFNNLLIYVVLNYYAVSQITQRRGYIVWTKRRVSRSNGWENISTSFSYK